MNKCLQARVMPDFKTLTYFFRNSHKHRKTKLGQPENSSLVEKLNTYVYIHCIYKYMETEFEDSCSTWALIATLSYKCKYSIGVAKRRWASSGWASINSAKLREEYRGVRSVWLVEREREREGEGKYPT